MNASLNLLVIRVSDLQASRRFYEAIGLAFKTERHGNGPEHLAAQLGGIIFEMYPSEAAAPATGVRVGFRVPSVAATVAALEQLGAEIAMRPQQSPWGMRAVAVDPDGNRVEITE